MSRILLADDSPHAQRMGERILREEGFEVVTLTDGDTVLVRLEDVDPDLILADVSLPGRTGFEICEHVKNSAFSGHIKVLLTAGALVTVEDSEVRRVRADGLLKKPFEASVLIDAVKPLLGEDVPSRPAPAPKKAQQPVAVVDPGRVRAAVTLAVDASMEKLVDEITERVLIALNAQRPPAAEKAQPLRTEKYAGQ
ncbi:MAG: response regulator [Bryobacteraceae bacterium]